MKRSIDNIQTSEIIGEKVLKASNLKDEFVNGESAFKILLGDSIAVEQFFSDYWEKKPLYLRRSDQEKWCEFVKDLFSLDALNSIIEKNKIKYETDLNLCKLVNGEKKQYNKKGVVKYDHVSNSFERDRATIQFHQPQRFCDNIWMLVEKLECLFGCLVGSNIYITPNDSQGLPAHHDDIEAFVIQLEGSKHWLLYEPIIQLPNDYRKTNNPDSLKVPSHDLILNPGDVLYFPRGTIHQAKTPKSLDSNSHSTHITISTYQNFNKMEYLTSTLNKVIQQSFSSNLCLREGLPLGFLKNQIDLPKFLKEELTKINIDSKYCYPVELMKDFMESRLPPFQLKNSGQENINSFNDLGKIQSLDDNLKIRLKYPEHTSYCIGFDEELDDSADDKDDDEEDDDDETADESDNPSQKQKLFIFYSTLNKKEKHMMPKNGSNMNCIKVHKDCLIIIEELTKKSTQSKSINPNGGEWLQLKDVKEKVQATDELKSLLISLKVENLIETTF